jgi:hypothetical protein
MTTPATESTQHVHPDDCTLITPGHHIAVHRSLHTSQMRPDGSNRPPFVDCEVDVSHDGPITVTFARQTRALWHHSHARLSQFLEHYSPETHGRLGFDPEKNQISVYATGSVEETLDALLPDQKRWDYQSTVLYTLSSEALELCSSES